MTSTLSKLFLVPVAGVETRIASFPTSELEYVVPHCKAKGFTPQLRRLSFNIVYFIPTRLALVDRRDSRRISKRDEEA